MVESGELYRHYKGGVYGVLTVAKHCDNNDLYVIYKDVATSEVYIRPLKDFEGETHGYKRFVLLEKVEIKV